MSLLEVDEVTKYYGQTRALKDVSFTMNGGEISALVGPNGSGKTTLLKLIAGVNPPTRGTVRVVGVNPWEESRIKSKVSLMPEVSGSYPNMNALHFLRLFQALYGDDNPGRCRDLLEQVGLMNRATSRIRTFSAGMKRRLDLARSLLNDPVLYLLDEPLAGLDPEIRALFRVIINDVARSGTGVLLSSHEIAYIEDLCDRVLVLYDGAVLYDGKPSEINARFATHSRLVVNCELLQEDLEELEQHVTTIRELEYRRGNLFAVVSEGKDIQRILDWLSRRGIHYALVSGQLESAYLEMLRNKSAS